MADEIKPLPVEYVKIPKIVFISLVHAIERLAQATLSIRGGQAGGLQYDLDVLRQAVDELTMPPNT